MFGGIWILLVVLSSMRVDMDMDDDISPGFLIALPYQGSANQLTCLIRAAYIAHITRRTLLLPKLYPSKHDSFATPQPFSDYISLNALFEGIQVRTAEAFLLRNYIANCITFGKWKSFSILGEPAASFAGTHSIEQLDWYDWPHPPHLSHLLTAMRGKKIACIANLQHIHVGNIDHVISKLKFRQSGDQLDLAIHWRRGDFASACKNKNMSQCLPPISRLQKIIQETSAQRIAIFTNDPAELQENDLAIYDLSSSDVFKDMSLMISAHMFIGNKYSTISRIVRVMRESKEMNKTDFF